MNQSRRDFLRTAGIGLASTPLTPAQTSKRPNFVIIFLDDSGWADFRPFGNPAYPTPNVERLASQGCQFHNFYVPQAICSASRSALLSRVLSRPDESLRRACSAREGLDPKFATMGEVLKGAGYEPRSSASGTSAISRIRVRRPGDSTSRAD